MKIFEAIKEAEEKFIQANFDKKTSKNDIEDILLNILKISKSKLFLKRKEEIGDIDKTIFFNAIEQRLKHKPVQYITNKSIFYGYDFFVNESCLIPRIDSEIIVEKVIDYIKKNKKSFKNKSLNILDACCGSGCLGLSIVKTLQDEKLLNNIDCQINLCLLDKSSNAIQVAKINAQKLNIDAKYIVSDILINGFGNEKYDIIVCNPPYIESDVISTLDEDVKNYEPMIALDGGKDGLTFYKSISAYIKKNIVKDGKIFFEIGYNQGKEVENIYNQIGFDVKIIKDYGKQDRCIILSYDK